nr:GNAT family N-acetyltransferase [Desulfobacula sp.]
MIAQSLLEQRFNLRRTQYLCERFEKSPNITEECFITNHLSICYSDSDVSIIPELCSLFLRMYLFTKNWFDYWGDMAIQLWVAPDPDDLKFMTCMPCAEGYACAPGTRNGAHIILIDSPLIGGKNSGKDRLSAVLAHEICHHFVTDISHATLFTMKRQENRDVPMWLEEGLGSLPDWFGIEKALVQYLRDIENMPTFHASVNDKILGFLSINRHTTASAEIHVMAVLPDKHGQGIGSALIKAAEKHLKQDGVKVIEVKTLGESHPDKRFYGETRKFYLNQNFFH